MGDGTAISWSDATWNPTVGCAHVSAGCDHCYAARVASTRLAHVPVYAGLAVRDDAGEAAFTGEVRCLEERLDQPLRWKRPRRIFVNSMSDLFHPQVIRRESEHGLSFLAEVLAVMATASWHQFQVLTKRPVAMASVLGSERIRDEVDEALARRHKAPLPEGPWPDHIWWGTSIELDQYAWRARHVRAVDAKVRFLSLEPLLGPLPSLELDGIGWVIVGGESGPGARPMSAMWAIDLAARCKAEGVPFHFKQAGAVLASEWACASMNGTDLEEFPEALRIREYPA